MLNLVMVLVFWCGKKGQVVEEYYDTFCRGSLQVDEICDLKARGSQDNNVYRDVWLEAFRTEIFKRFHTVIKTGDNGSALKSYDTFYLHTVLMSKHHIRIFYFTLCPYHAENLCDPAGAQTKKATKKFERKMGKATGDARQTAEARNQYRGPKVKEAKWIECLKEYNEYTPEEMIRNKQKGWPYSLNKCCVVFFQVTNIHQNSESPTETIELGGVGYGAPTAREKFGCIDLRWHTLFSKSICVPCSTRFRRSVLLSDHNQKGFYLCPKTNVYTRETDLDRLCLRCNKTVREAHMESPNQSDDCPTQTLETAGKTVYTHKYFCVISIDGERKYPIELRGREQLTPTDFTAEQLAELRSRFKAPKSVEKKQTLQPGSLAEAQMLAPGITIIFKRESNAKATLSWGLGVITSVDKEKQTFVIQVYSPSNAAVTVAPWGKWVESHETKHFSWTDTTWLKVNRLTRGKIPLQVLHKIRTDGRFKWQWISNLDLTDVPKSSDLEFAPNLDDDREHRNQKE